MGNAREEEKKMRNKTKTGKRKTSRIVAHGQSVDRERATERAIVKSTLGFSTVSQKESDFPIKINPCSTSWHIILENLTSIPYATFPAQSETYVCNKKHTNPIATCHF